MAIQQTLFDLIETSEPGHKPVGRSLVLTAPTNESCKTGAPKTVSLGPSGAEKRTPQVASAQVGVSSVSAGVSQESSFQNDSDRDHEEFQHADSPRGQDSNSPRDLEGTPDRGEALRRLRAQIGCVTTAPDESIGTFSTGSPGVNHWLPRGGLRVDAVTEWAGETDGCGAAGLSLIAAAERLNSAAGPLVVVAGKGVFYPPAAISLGIAAGRIIWVQPNRHADLVWAIDQSLRCRGVAAVWAAVGPNLDDRDARRFQLAAETGQTPGLFLRPSSVRGRPSFADVRFHVVSPVDGASSGNQRRLQITLDRCRGARIGQQMVVEIDDRARIHDVVTDPTLATVTPPLSKVTHHETAAVRLASELAHPASAVTGRRKRA